MVIWDLLIIPFSGILGSFIGAFTYRFPKGIDFVSGRSFCDRCHRQLGWRYNVPIFSYLFLGGKSACCGKKISSRYLWIELSSVAGAVFLFSSFPIWQFVFFYLLFLVCLSILVIDLEYQIIPDELVWLVIILFFLNIKTSVFPSLFSGLLSALILLLIHLLTRGRGMGLGDVKLAVALGLWLTVYNSLIWLLGAFLTGGVVASILLIIDRAKWKQEIAFGPFLIVSFLFVFFIKKI